MPKNSEGLIPVPGTALVTEDGRTNRNDTLTKEEFVSFLRKGEALDLNGYQISDEVNLKGVKVENPVEIRNLKFTGEVNFSGARFERGVDFTGCRFQRLILSDARFEGSLILNTVVIGAETEHLLRRKQRRRSDQAKRSKPPVVADFTNLRVAGCLSMMNVTVYGGLSCAQADIEDDFRIDEARIHGDLKLRRAHLGELCTDAKKRVVSTDAAGNESKEKHEKPCRVDGTLDLASASVAGDVRLIGALIGGKLTLETADINGNLLCMAGERVRTRLRNGAWLLGTRVRGNVDFNGTQLHGGLNLRTAKIGGALRCSPDPDSESPGKWFFRMDGDFNLIGAKIENNVDFAGFHLEGNLNLQNALIGGTLFLTVISSPGKNVRCEITKKAWLLGVTVAGDVDISGVRIGDDLIMQSTNIGQNFVALTMGGFPSQIEGDIHLNGSRIRGEAQFGGAVLKGELDLDGASIEGGLRATFYPNDTKNWKIECAQFGGKIHARSATIGNRVILMGVTARAMERAAGDVAEKEQGVDFVGAQINGEFSLYSEGIIREIVQEKKAAFQAKELSENREEEIRAEARRERTEIEGDLRLTRTHVLGNITLDGATINGKLDMRDANVRANINCRPIKSDDGKLTRASVHSADFETLDMIGDMELTGLDISGKEDGSDGDLILRDARIRGRLELCPSSYKQNQAGGKEYDDKDYKGKITLIHGNLRLNAAEISHAILTGDILAGHRAADRRQSEMVAAGHERHSAIMWLLRGGGEEDEKDIPARVELERATIGRLQIFQPLPGTLDLSNLKVDSWDWPKDRSRYFNDMLKNSHPFKKSNYLDIEKALRNRGEDEQADEVHVLMRRRDRGTKSFWRALFDVFLNLSIKYGTTSKRLACVMLVWFAISVWIFSDRNHVEYDIDPQVDKPQTLKRPESWGTGNAALLAARLHVPIISLGVQEKVQPSGTDLKAYAMTVVALSWVMWPLLIASASGFIRKRD